LLDVRQPGGDAPIRLLAAMLAEFRAQEPVMALALQQPLSRL